MQDIGREGRKSLCNKTVEFDPKKKILIVGCGAVAQCALPLIPRLINVDPSKITVIDMEDKSAKIKYMIEQGVRFFVEKITKTSLTSVLEKYLDNGDFLFDLAYEIETVDLLRWCYDHSVLYINASLEVWDPYMDARETDSRRFTLYQRHMDLRDQLEKWKDNIGPTAVIDHGANPGLVSHFVKQGLVHIAEKIIKEKPNEDLERTNNLKAYLAAEDWPRLAMTTGVKVIHISERDTQISSSPKRVNEFVNTWSCEGFYEEGVAPAELGWGTHERTLPADAVEHTVGPKNQISLKTKGMDTLVRSWVPTPNDSGDIIGMVVRHGEAFSISDYLTVKNDDGEVIYRPTVHYAYCPCNDALCSIDELRMRHYNMQPTTRILDESTIIEGCDLLGCLLMGHDFKSWWIGSLLDIGEARELIPYQNATTVQVAISMVAATQWALENPRQGVVLPDALPYKEILEQCYPYLGPVISRSVDWTPNHGRELEAHHDYLRKPVPLDEDVWQFDTFLIHRY